MTPKMAGPSTRRDSHEGGGCSAPPEEGRAGGVTVSGVLEEVVAPPVVFL